LACHRQASLKAVKYHGRVEQILSRRKPRVSKAFEVDLIEGLSHIVFSGQLDRLAARNWELLDAPREKPLQNGKTSRSFGEVGDAVVQVLAEARCELRMMDIHAAVEDLLGEPVSRSSVKNYLARGCNVRKTPLFERVSRGQYRLLHRAE
jgi:hypothetical protein